MTVTILKGDCREVLRELPADSVNCVVTSPPYWGLRDYGHAGQIGLEPTYTDYVDKMVGAIDAVRRVLRKDGTVWLNLGDSYATGAGAVGDCPGGGEQGARWRGGPPSDKSTLRGNGHVGGGPKLHALEPVPVANRGVHTAEHSGKQAYRIEQMGPMTQPNRMPQPGLKPKDLCGIPWRVALALQADGWWLRQDIIWSKPNPMPESVRDRCTKAHEYLFLLSKSERYHYDASAIAEAAVKGDDGSRFDIGKTAKHQLDRMQERPQRARALEIARENGLTEEHIAAIRACGVTDVGKARVTQNGTGKNLAHVQALADHAKVILKGYYREFLTADDGTRNRRSVWTVPTEPFGEAHFATFPPALIEPCVLAGCPKGGTVLDPFGGAGTTGLVADRLGRNAILIELNPEYAAMAERRIKADAGMFAEVQ